MSSSTLSRTRNSSGVARLNDYIAAARKRPFAWGEHDCVQFVRGHVEMQTDRLIPVPSYRGKRGAVALLRTYDLKKELDARFARCPHVPPRGSIVARKTPEDRPLGYVLGIVVSDRAAFVSPNGLVFAKLEPETDSYWIVPCAAS